MKATNADYEGIRVRFTASLGTAKIHLHIDIGFGNTVYPKPVKETLPAPLDFPASELFCYSKESAIAEKFEAMIKMGILNSRVKDFYDIWLLSRQFRFSYLCCKCCKSDILLSWNIYYSAD